MTVLLASLAAPFSLVRREGRPREAAASRRAWLRSAIAALRRWFWNQRTSGITKNAAAYACARVRSSQVAESKRLLIYMAQG